MTLRPSLIVPVRNKAKHVGSAIRSCLAQTYKDLRIVVSDQGSTDGSMDVVQDILEDYKGPHEILLLECPDTTPNSMEGLNAHLDWVIRQLYDSNVIMVLGADDDQQPTRVERVMEAFQATGASYVGTHCFFVDPTGKDPQMQSLFPKETGFVDPTNFFGERIGGSCSCNFKRELYEEFPLRGDMINDLWLPYFGTCRDGMFVIAEPLASYIKHADVNNTGVEGQLRATKDPVARQEIEVKIWRDISMTLEKIFTRAQGMKPEEWPQPSRQGLYVGIIEHAIGWSRATAFLNKLKESPELQAQVKAQLEPLAAA